MKGVTTAVILAAGLGIRLKDRTKDCPKGFLEIDGDSLIERSIKILIDHGIERILIGTGYLHGHFDKLKSKHPQIITHHNPDYKRTGSMYTLYCMANFIDEQFLLLESDLLYEPASLDYLLSDSREDIILASAATNSGDEVFIQCTTEGNLQSMNKNRNLLTHVDGELVGISKISSLTLKKMMAFSEQQYSLGNRDIHYEDALVGVAQKQKLPVKVINNLAWCEIDDESHLQRALALVYPEILKRK